jgi:hypothetical protein
MCRDDLLAGLDAQQRGECPRNDEHRTTHPNETIHCDDCDRTYRT